MIPVLLEVAIGCAVKEPLLENELKTEIRDVVIEGEAWWNKGTLDGYLKRYPDRATMGRLDAMALELIANQGIE